MPRRLARIVPHRPVPLDSRNEARLIRGVPVVDVEVIPFVEQAFHQVDNYSASCSKGVSVRKRRIRLTRVNGRRVKIPVGITQCEYLQPGACAFAWDELLEQ